MKTRRIEISEETYQVIVGLQREGETVEEALTRLALAFRASGLMSYDVQKQRERGAAEESSEGRST